MSRRIYHSSSVLACVLLFLVTFAESSPQITTTNILLPPSPNLAHPVQLTKGCWTVRGDTYNAESDDDLVDVVPTSLALRGHGGVGLECLVVQQEDESCHRDFRISVREAKRLGVRSLVFVKMSDPDDPKQVEMRVDVRVAELKGLEILTTTRRVEVGEKEILQVIGRDTDQNVFSSLSGLDFAWQIESGTIHVELQSLEDANIVNDEETSSDKSRQSALGLSTGRALVSVKLGQLQAKVELTVARTLTICPGPLVGVFPGTKLDALFCLNRLGCFASSKQFKSKVRNANDDFDWVKEYGRFTEQGTFQVEVQDKIESTNKATSQVVVGALSGITHHIALNVSSPSSGAAPEAAEGECPYYKSRNSEWPPLSKLLPQRDAFKHNLSRYYLVKGKTYIFMGLAKLSNNGYVAPHTHETMEFDLQQTHFFKSPGMFQQHTTLVTPREVGTTTAKVRFRDQSAIFLLTVTDPLQTIPSESILMTPGCKMTLQVTGGSGMYRSRYRARTNLTATSLLQVQNWTGLQTRPFPTGEANEDGRFQVWDEADESNRVDLALSIRNYERLRIKDKHYYVQEGSVVTLDVQAASGGGEVRVFHCCESIQGFWEELSMGGSEDENLNLLVRLEEDSVASLSSASCASASYQASQIGTTRVRFTTMQQNNPIVVSTFVTVFPRLRLEPESAVLAIGSSVTVRILGGPQPSQITVNGEITHARSFQASCAKKEGSSTFVVYSSAHDIEMQASFQLHCITPSHCQVDLAGMDDWKPIKQGFIAQGTPVRILTSVFGRNEQNITLPSWGDAKLTVDGTPVVRSAMYAISKSAQADDEEELIFRASISDLNFTCDKRIQVRSPLIVYPRQQRETDEETGASWFWSGCEAKFRMEGGSGQFAVHSETLDSALVGPAKRDVIVKVRPGKSAASTTIERLAFSDLNYYPDRLISRLVSFLPMDSLALKQTPSFTVQHADILFELDPIPPPAFAAASSSLMDFDWSAYHLEHSSLEWEPSEMFELKYRQEAKSFLLTALKPGNATIKFRLCSQCDLAKCITGTKRVHIEKYRSAAIFPGSRYNLSSCDDLGPLSGCHILSENATSSAQLLTVFPNGTVVGGCSPARAVVTCAKDDDRQKTNVYFHVFVHFPTKIDWYPSGNGSDWILQQHNSTYQIHTALSMGESTCFVAESSSDGEQRVDTWEFTVDSDKKRPRYHTVRSSKGLASLPLVLDKKGVWTVAVVVKFGSLNETCPVSTITELRHQRKYLVHEPPRLMSPSRLLLPPSSRYEIVTVPAVHTCALASCGCEDFTLTGCTLWVAKTPRRYGVLCTVTITGSGGADDAGGGGGGGGSGFASTFPYHAIAIETRPVSSLSAHVREGHKLEVFLHDDHSRVFTQGWADIPGQASRSVRFVPSRTVVLESDYLFNGQVNCSQSHSLESMHVSTTSKKKTSKGTIVVSLFENDVLVAKALVDKIERLCSRTFLGFFCLDDTESVVVTSVWLAMGIASLQGYQVKELAAFVFIVTMYFLML